MTPVTFTRKTSNSVRTEADINELQAAIEDIDANGTDGGTPATLTVQDEGSALTTAATTLNFVGSGVIATGSAATKTITIAGAAGGSGSKLGYVVASNDAPTAFKNLADYVCDGVADDVQIQAAIDAATANVAASTAAATNVYLLPGRYYLATGITGKSARVIGGGIRTGVTIYWNGAAGATAWTQSAASTGSITYGGISGVTFTIGTAAPGVWLDLTADGIDNGWRLENVGFGGGAIQIKTATWVNAHWRNLRFDSWTDFALVLTPGSTQTLATFVIDQFTCDHHPATSANGFIKIDNTANASNLGTFTLRGGRMESNFAYGGNKGLIELVSPNPGNTRVIDLVLDNVTYQEITATPATHSLVYSNTAATTIGISLTLRNFRQSGLDVIVAGTLVSGHPIIPLQANYAFASINAAGTETIFTDYLIAEKSLGINTATITSGTGAPSASSANGSLYLRTDGTSTTTIYRRAAGAWTAVG